MVLLKHNGLALVFSTTKMLALFAKQSHTEQNILGYVNYVHHVNCSIMENIFLVKIPKNVNQRKHIYTITFCQKFLTQLKSRILTIKIGVIFFLCKNLFFFARLNRFLYFWVFKCQISACWFLNH